MRSEKEMLDLIIRTAQDDVRIRAVIMNGSRANPNAPRDIMQDFDIVYIVTDVESFREDEGWIEQFGEILIMQMPDAMDDPPPADDGSFAYLVQFAGGNRLDLTLFPLDRLDEMHRDSLSILLLDKGSILDGDALIAPFPPPSEANYLPCPPSAQAYADCCNEFWWLGPYVAKGLWRRQPIYARHVLDSLMRDQLIKMLTWHAGIRTRFAVNLGGYGKYLHEHIDPDLYPLLWQTYATVDDDSSWAALYAMCRLFRTAARHVAEHFGFDYPSADDERVSAYLRHVQALPRDAHSIF
ncbi:MAG TPA: aminoglycoside 6-adenylyltransferase [Chloroflexi bacterium]|nr:aminoglycoside 6-adenylyltransferase [Chloroflexota bacterium]